MPFVTLSPNGLSVSAGGVGKHERAKRERCKGFTASAARRQIRFLQSVKSDQLVELGLALTLTMRELPAGPEELHEALDAFYRCCDRRGMIRGHWVIELQERGVPHFHLAVYFDRDPADDWHQLARELVSDWLRIANDPRRSWGARGIAQHVDVIATGVGWAKYCAKHAGRSVRHYQREGLPDGWDYSGRLWGKWGGWPTMEQKLEVDAHTFLQLRRLMRAWRRADAAKALSSARSALVRARTPEGQRTAAHHVRVAEFRVKSSRRHFTPRSTLADPAERILELRTLSWSVGMREWVPIAVSQELVAHLVDSANSPMRFWRSSGRRDFSAGLPAGWWEDESGPHRPRPARLETVTYHLDGVLIDPATGEELDPVTGLPYELELEDSEAFGLARV